MMPLDGFQCEVSNRASICDSIIDPNYLLDASYYQAAFCGMSHVPDADFNVAPHCFLLF